MTHSAAFISVMSSPMYKKLQHFRERLPLAAIGLEIFSIVLAVLLALGVNEWREARNNQQLAKTALRSVAEEARSNRSILKKRIAAHERLVDRLNNAQAAYFQGEPFADSLNSLDLGLFVMRRSAYESARASQALPHIDFAITNHLAKTEHIAGSLEVFDNLIRQWSANMLELDPVSEGSVPSNDFSNVKFNANALVNLQNYSRELLRNERALLHRETELLQMIKAKGITVPANTSTAFNTTRAAQP